MRPGLRAIFYSSRLGGGLRRYPWAMRALHMLHDVAPSLARRWLHLAAIRMSHRGFVRAGALRQCRSVPVLVFFLVST